MAGNAVSANKKIRLFKFCMRSTSLIQTLDRHCFRLGSWTLYRVAKLYLKVGSRRTTEIENLVVLVIILVDLILLHYHYVCPISSHTAVFIGHRKII